MDKEEIMLPFGEETILGIVTPMSKLPTSIRENQKSSKHTDAKITREGIR
jgi:hypothetical protein